MVAINPLARQPTNIDFARTTQFKFSLLKIPNVEYFTTTASIPGISFTGDADINTPFKTGIRIVVASGSTGEIVVLYE